MKQLKKAKQDSIFILGSLFISYLYIDTVESSSPLWSLPVVIMLLAAMHKAGKRTVSFFRKRKYHGKTKRLSVKF